MCGLINNYIVSSVTLVLLVCIHHAGISPTKKLIEDTLALSHPAFAALLLARRRYARPRQHETLERTSREAEFDIFGEEGPAVVSSAQEHPQSAHHPLTAEERT